MMTRAVPSSSSSEASAFCTQVDKNKQTNKQDNTVKSKNGLYQPRPAPPPLLPRPGGHILLGERAGTEVGNKMSPGFTVRNCKQPNVTSVATLSIVLLSNQRKRESSRVFFQNLAEVSGAAASVSRSLSYSRFLTL